MNNQNSSRLLDWAFSDKVSANVDLADRVMKKAMLSPTLKSSPRMKFVVPALIALGAVILLTSIGYAVYLMVIDPGLRRYRRQAWLLTLRERPNPPAFPLLTRRFLHPR